MYKKKLGVISLVALMVIGGAAMYSAPKTKAAAFGASEGSASITKSFSEDVFWAGQKALDFKSIVNGEVFLAGDTINIENKSGRSVFAAGNIVNIKGGSGYNAFLAGAKDVNISGEYDHDVYVAGTNVVVEEGALIKGDLRVAGSSFVLAGKVEGNVFFDTTNITVKSSANVSGALKGAIQSDFTFEGGVIGGDLVYEANKEASGLDKVKVQGKTERNNLPKNNTDNSFSMIAWLFGLLSTIGLCLLVALLVPRLPKDVEHEFKSNWARAFWVGFSFIIGVPMMIILFIVTGIGLPVGLIILLFYCLLLMISSAVSFIVAGRFILNQFKQSTLPLWVATIVGVTVIKFFAALPSVGWIFSAIIFACVTTPVISLVLNWMKKQNC